MQLALSGRVVEQAGGTAMPVVDFVQMAARCGYDCVDLRASQAGPETSETELAALEDTLAETGVSVAMLNLRSLPEEGEGGELDQMFDLAERLGCTTLRVSGPVRSCRQAAQAAGARGLRLCAQIHTGGEYETVSLARGTLAAIGYDNYGVLVEPANLLMAGEGLDEAALRPIANSIFGVNFQSLKIVGADEGNALNLRDGTQVNYKRVPIRENDQINLGRFLAALNAVGFDGFINVLEPMNPEVEPAAVARDSAEALREMIQGF